MTKKCNRLSSYICALAVIATLHCQNLHIPLSPPLVKPKILEVDSKIEISSITALVIYAQDKDDSYPFPDRELRQKVYSRITEYYQVMSYGKHDIRFLELGDQQEYIKTSRNTSEYRQLFNENKEQYSNYRGPFSLFNEEVLQTVLKTYGEDVFRNINLLIIAGTDGGPDWYMPGVNAQGFASIGFEFTAAGKTFDLDEGGITVEIGSDYISSLFSESELFWTFAHEYGHWLGYRKHRPKSIGIYSLMTPSMCRNANFDDPEFGPNPLDPYLLMRFGWLNRNDSTRVQIIQQSENEQFVTLDQIRSPEGVVLAMIPLPGTENQSVPDQTIEYFTIAYHRRDANRFDACYLNSGLLIWHSVLEDYLDIECAEGHYSQKNRDHFDFNRNMGGLAGDFFVPGMTLKFTPESNPDSNIWGMYDKERAGEPSGVSIDDIQLSGEKVSFRVRFE